MSRTYDREAWGARTARDRSSVTKAKRTGAAFHHTTGSSLGRDDCAEWVRAIQKFHMDERGWDDIGYNLLVCAHGDRFEGRSWGTLGAHASGHNTTHVGICAMGDLRRVDNMTDDLLAGLVVGYDDACAWAGKTLKPVGHGQLPGASTACPGRLTGWLRDGMDLAPDDAVPPRGRPPADRLILPAKPVIVQRRTRPARGSRIEVETRRVQAELAYVHGLKEAVGAIDGWPGPKTARAVELLQRRHGGVSVDGIPGPETWPVILG